ncbi:hypothetical protein N7541_010222 [Penicillium brevicompactum]|uniref:Uncharacterized protein n=1 Tax=Penicillium brevicompactum TaxID=5074 RepID=A0A9W9QNA8_PENBR|nr:hypothetical protein N7541_010222 [Penicillium brevicompactum]
MIRRAPTFIALEEDDIDSHLQRIFLHHTLIIDLEQLHLDESDLSSSAAGTNLDRGSTRASSHSSPGSSTIPQPEKSCLRAPASVCRDLQSAITFEYPADGSDPPKPKVTYALSPQELELHSGRAIHSPGQTETERLGEYYPTSHKSTITGVSVDSPISPQVSFLSCGVSSSPATVPLRDLALASTMSYEAGLAEEAISSASAERWRGTHLHRH